MDASQYSQLVQQILTKYARLINPKNTPNQTLIFDTQNDHCVFLANERHDDKRRYGITLHIDIIDGKIWIQRDGTEEGIIDDSMEAGVPKEHIVLGYRSPFVRQHTEFAMS